MTTPISNERPAPPAAVSVIGLGPMGRALAEALLARGHVTTVWNRSQEKVDDLVSRGARAAGSAAAAVAASGVTLVCLKDYATMYQVLEAPAGAPDGPADGRVLVHLSSGTPGEARAAAEWAAQRGYGYLDGAVMVPPAAVGQPEAVLLYSGPAPVFDRHREVLAGLGTPRHLGADPGLAVLHNAALLDLMYASLNGFLHAAALVGTVPGQAATFARLAEEWFLPSVVFSSLDAVVSELAGGDHPGEEGTMEMNRNALEHIARTSEEQGISRELPDQMRALTERAVAEGYGDSNYLAVHELFRRP